MKITRNGIFACVVLIPFSFGAFASADQLDDLLAGKPVLIESTASEGRTPESVATSDSPDEQLAAEVAHKPELGPRLRTATTRTSAQHDFDMTLVEPSHASALDAHSTGHSVARPAMTISMVPEPSAIFLAILALGYFLLFFRRRYAM